MGLKILNNAAVIQGDGISDRSIFEQILPAVVAAGWCPSNVAFGMGEYNHRAVRSDIECGYKTAIVGAEDTESGFRPVMKGSNTLWKRSFPCAVKINADYTADMNFKNRVEPIIIPQLKNGDTGSLVVHYDGRQPNGLKVDNFIFTQSRDLAYQSWNELPPVVGDTCSPAIRKMQENFLATH